MRARADGFRGVEGDKSWSTCDAKTALENAWSSRQADAREIVSKILCRRGWRRPIYRAGAPSLLHRLSRVRCPQPWPRPTSHVPDGDAGAAETASAALFHRIRLSSPAGSLPTPPQPARRSLRRAVWRNPKSLPPSLCGRGGVRIRAA